MLLSGAPPFLGWMWLNEEQREISVLYVAGMYISHGVRMKSGLWHLLTNTLHFLKHIPQGLRCPLEDILTTMVETTGLFVSPPPMSLSSWSPTLLQLDRASGKWTSPEDPLPSPLPICQVGSNLG